MAYITTPDLKAYLNIPTGTTTHDTLLAAFIVRAQAIIDGHCGRTFEAATNTAKYFDALSDVDGRTLWVGAHDLASIASIYNGDDPYTVIASDEYVTEPRNGTPIYAIRLLGSSGVSWTYEEDPENAISVTGKWAYSVTAPADIQQATIRMASYLYRQRDNSGDLDRALLAEGRVILPTDLPGDVARILRPYVREV